MARIYIDGSIRGGKSAFEGLGTVTLFDGYALKEDPGLARDAEILVTRSITHIGEPLLSSCPGLLAVASPTIGTDHVDFDALARYRTVTDRPVPWFHAPGATSGGVADFALAAIVESTQRLDRPMQALRVGIWGFGNCGTALAARLRRFALPWVAYDPPLEERSDFKGASLTDLLSCDIISLHVPLTSEQQSPWPTHHRVDRTLLEQLSGAPRILVNTSRGAVVDNRALLDNLENGRSLVACLDVWEDEPFPLADLVERCALATPHCAGSVLEGRDRSVFMVRDAVAGFLGLPMPSSPPSSPDHRPVATGDPPVRGFMDKVDIGALSHRFKSAYGRAIPGDRGRVFDETRVTAERHEVRWD
ncbi:MAG: hypothetical protein ISR64_01255 [Deltaproteobacteria bacterium]|nr:hypothetical protein [Deltaproteobacteria bacterium]